MGSCLLVSVLVKQLVQNAEISSPWQFSFMVLLIVWIYFSSSVSMNYSSLPSDDVETKTHLSCLSLDVWWLVFSFYCGLHHKIVLSSTEQMVLYGGGSIYYENWGQKQLLVEWFPSMQAKNIHICYTHLILHIKVSKSFFYMTLKISTVLHIHNHKLCVVNLTKTIGHWQCDVWCVTVSSLHGHVILHHVFVNQRHPGFTC